jgi:hypothetical protein
VRLVVRKAADVLMPVRLMVRGAANVRLVMCGNGDAVMPVRPLMRQGCCCAPGTETSGLVELFVHYNPPFLPLGSNVPLKAATYIKYVDAKRLVRCAGLARHSAGELSADVAERRGRGAAGGRRRAARPEEHWARGSRPQPPPGTDHGTLTGAGPATRAGRRGPAAPGRGTRSGGLGLDGRPPGVLPW